MTYVSSSKTNTIPSVWVYNWAYATPFNVGDSAAFTFTLKWYDAVVSQSIPIVVYENGVQVAQDTFAVTVLPQGMCTSTNTETNTGTGTNSWSTNPNPTIIYGCTNASATNYNSTATHDNGTCTYAPTTQPVYGCTSYLATNYNSAATHNDGTCIFVNPVYGCKNPAAINYNSKATVDNGQCILPTTTAKTGSTATGTTNTGTTQIPVPDTKKDDTTDIIAGKPSKTNFFVVNPSPKKTTKQPIAEVKKLTEKVTVVKAQIDMSDDKVFEEQLLKAMECEDTMVDIYNYASEAWLITKYDIKDLCGPITRIKFAGIMVKFMLNLAIIEPDLKRNCSFDDLAGLTNEEKFNAALACDFGIMGVDDNGKVLKSFKPNETVTKAVAAKALTNFVFGDTYKKALAWQAWYEPAMKILHESYVIRSVENPAQEMLLWHVLLMLKRVDFGELVKQTKYIILRNRK